MTDNFFIGYFAENSYDSNINKWMYRDLSYFEKKIK